MQKKETITENHSQSKCIIVEGSQAGGPLQKRGHNVKSEIIREIVGPSKCQKLCHKVSSTRLPTEDQRYAQVDEENP